MSRVISELLKLRCSRVSSGIFLLFLYVGLFQCQAQYTATVDLNTRYQTFEGWGTSLAWWANVVGGYPDTYRNDYVTKFFDPVNGLGLNIVRYNIGGGENPSYLPPNTAYLQYRARVPGFLSSATSSYDWTQDANQRWVLQQAILRGVNITEAFVNSPPYWMTNSGSVSGAVGGGDNLNTSYTSAYADYITTVVQHYHDTWGITFRTLEAFNEPNSGYWKFGGNQEVCGFTPTTQNSVAKVVGASLAQKGITYTTLSASDETSIDQAVSTLGSLDSTTLGYISQINTHTYAGTKRSQLASAAATAGKNLWMSEYGDNGASGLATAAQILKDVNTLKARSWIMWQAVDNSTGWGLFKNVLDGTATYSYTVNEKYYVMVNFSRFIRPGYQIVNISDSNSVAAYDGLGTIVIVTVSQSSADQAVTYSLSNFGSSTWNVAQYRTSSTESLAAQVPFSVSGTSFTKIIPANSVTTFVLTNGASSPFVTGKTYKITNVNSSAVLEVPNSSTTAGQALDQGTYNSGSNQQWIATAAGANWVLTNVNSGLAMDISASTSGSTVLQNTVTNYTTQIWNAMAVGDGSYKLVNASTGLDLEVAGASSYSGASIDQATDNSGSSQHWKITEIMRQGELADTQLTMTSSQSPIQSTDTEQLSAALTSSTGSAAFTGTITFYDGSVPIGSYTALSSSTVASLSTTLSVGTHYISAVYSGDTNYNPSSTSTFPVVVTGSMPVITSGHTYVLKNVNSSDVLDVPGSSTVTEKVLDQWSSNNGTNQMWVASSAGANWVFKSASSGLALDVAASTTGSSVTQNTVTYSATQRWAVVAVGDGSYKIVNASTGFLMEVVGASKTAGAFIDQAADSGAASQHWTIIDYYPSLSFGKTFLLTNMNSGEVLDVPSSSTSIAQTLDQAVSTGAANQQWTAIGDGTNWSLVNVNSGLAVDLASRNVSTSLRQ